ncbi:Ig-like domain-containing protein, partial [bacterium]|nr:Ig-like domain-containing protein [bacterium]
MTIRKILSFLTLLITIVAFVSCSSNPKSAVDNSIDEDVGAQDFAPVDDDETIDETVDETADNTIDEDVGAQDFAPVDDDETVDEAADNTIDEDVGAQDFAPVDDDETIDETIDEIADNTIDEDVGAQDFAPVDDDETVDEDVVLNDPPTVLSVTPLHLASIGKTDDIVIVFSETIDKTTFILGGSSSSLSGEGIWSTTTVADDTVTLTPASEWVTGDIFLTIDYADLLGAAGEMLSLHYTVQVLFVNEGTGTTATGDINDPLHSIREALAAAHVKWPNDAEVHVMEGSYTLDGDNDIAPLEGISLYGGYESGNWSHRDSSLYISQIQGSNTKDRVVFFGSNITAKTVIDGFTILGGTNTESVNIIGILCHESSPTISHNIIQGGSTVEESWGIYATHSAAPLITDNSIHGGSGSVKTKGIYLGLNAFPTITKNTIYGGDPTDNSVGIYNAANSYATITDNIKIDGGSGEYSRAVFNSGTSTATVKDNADIFGGKNRESIGIKNSNTSKALIQNNTINGGEGSDTRGIENDDLSEASIGQNTIIGGKGTQYTCGIVNMKSAPFIIQNNINGGDGILYACGIANLETSTPIITQNTINGGSALQSTGIYNEDVTAQSGIFFNRNTINAGDGTMKSGGISIKNSLVALANNTIFGGSATNSYGIGADNSEIIAVNNTIDGGSGNTAHGIGCESSEIMSVNNIIFTSTTLQGFGVFEEDGNCTINVFETNNIYGCSRALYHEYTVGGGTNHTAIFSLESYLNNKKADSASDNISELLLLDGEYRFIGTLDSVSFDTAGADFSGMI